MEIKYVDQVSGEVKTRQATAEEMVFPGADETEQLEGMKEGLVEELKRNAFQEEADPLYFKAQRGEATMEEWLAKVEEIRLRFV